MPAPTPSDLCVSDLGDALEPRVRALNEVGVGEGEYVLCWLQQALRSHDNPAIDTALTVANALDLPVLVYHGIREDYPYASWRLHDFLIGASRELERGCEARGILCVNLVVRPSKPEKGLVYRLAETAALVVTDDQPLFVGRWQADRFAARTKTAAKSPTAVWAVECGRLVPQSTLRDGIKTTKGFRSASKAQRDGPWAVTDDVEVRAKPYGGPLAFESDRLASLSDADLLKLIRECRIDQSLPPSRWIFPTRDALDTQLGLLRDVVLPRYKWTRNTPAEAAGASHLSPWLHFGMVGPREVDAIVETSDAPAACKWKFRDELLTWREWFHYLAVERDSPADYANIPAWARETLDAHRDDPREHIYTLSELLHAQTDDPVWNAAQTQFLLDGYMHNNLRMYWGKQILRWTASPEAAWSTACYLNDRLSYDGRDPATYGNLEWVFGRGRPGYREIEVYGLVAPKSNRAILKRKGMTEWLAAQNARERGRVAVPNGVPDYTSTDPALGPYFPMGA